jgi:hypothetical protein
LYTLYSFPLAFFQISLYNKSRIEKGGVVSDATKPHRGAGH